jgi:3'-phosphoadenosine 5'-phosphosulfate (PAPS) 3'-phosphatase
MIDQSNDLTLAHQMADLADAISSRHFTAAGVESELKSDGTPVTAADREIEHALHSLIDTTRRPRLRPGLPPSLVGRKRIRGLEHRLVLR